MSKLLNDNDLDLFYKMVKEQYPNMPNINKEVLLKLSEAPFKYLKHIMEGGTFETVRFLNLGLFYVKPRYVSLLLKKNRDKYIKHKINHDNYIRNETNYVKFLFKNLKKINEEYLSKTAKKLLHKLRKEKEEY